jgi:hypothetical protein
MKVKPLLFEKVSLFVHWKASLELNLRFWVLRCCKSLKVCFSKHPVLFSSESVAAMGEIFTTVKGKETVCS